MSSSSSSSSSSPGSCTYTWNGTAWELTVDNCGNLTATPPPTPSSGSSIPVGTTREGTCKS